MKPQDIPAKALKAKKCAVRTCRKDFIQYRSLVKWCSPECGAILAEQKLAKQKALEAKRERLEVFKRKMELKPLQWFLKKAERAVNAYVRFRDNEQPCISCNTWDTEEWHAGHFRSVGACSSARFDYANIHRQCSQCNTHKSGNATEYENSLRVRLGDAEVDRIKAMPKRYDWTRDELLAIEAKAKADLKQLQRDVS